MHACEVLVRIESAGGVQAPIDRRRAHPQPGVGVVGVGGAHAHEAEAGAVDHAEHVELPLLLPLQLQDAPLHSRMVSVDISAPDFLTNPPACTIAEPHKVKVHLILLSM